jgi:di/tricarboxylate transporter
MNRHTPATALPLWQAWKEDYFLWTLLLLCAVQTVSAPGRLASYPALVDWPTIAALTGLLVITKSVELSGFLHQLGHRLITRMRSERHLALFLVAASALLAMLLTNDIALFVVVPLTLSLHGMAALPTVRLVVFEALAVNAGSALTPVGNPQNLFLWQRSGESFHGFVGQMLPLALIFGAVLAAFTACAFRGRAIVTTEDAKPPPLDRRLLLASVVLYPVFLVAADLHFAGIGLGIVLAVFLLHGDGRHVLKRVDWTLIAVFILMFIDLRLMAQQAFVRDWVARANLSEPQHLYLAGIAISQAISNVPGAILLAQHSADWRLIAYAVNVAGFGFAMGSLANLIALRMLRVRRAWLTFHGYSIPFLLIAGTLVYVWLFAR